MIIQEKLEVLSFFDQLVIGIEQRFCRHEWCDHHHIYYTDSIGLNWYLNQRFCPKCGRLEAN